MAKTKRNKQNRWKKYPQAVINDVLTVFDQHLDDESVAHATLLLFPDEFLHCPELGWMHWTGTHWKRKGGRAAVKRAIRQTLRIAARLAVDRKKEALQKFAVGSRHRVNGALFMLESILYIDIDEFDDEPYKLNTQNGVIDLRDGVIYKHNGRTHRFTYCIPIDYNESADTSIIEAHLRDDLADPDDMVPFFKRILGYSITGDTREEVLFYLQGPPRAGKDTIAGAVLQMLGEPLAREVTFETLTDKRYGDTNRADIATLRPARFVTGSENNRKRPMNGAVIKNQTGGNQQFVAMKGKDHFSFKPAYKLWLVSNWEIELDNRDDAAWGRLVLIAFPNNRLGKADPTRKARTLAPAFQQALLTWAVQGAQEWLREGLQVPQCAEDRKNRQRGAVGPVVDFVKDLLKHSPGKWIETQAMADEYNDWCLLNGYEAEKPRKFIKTMMSSPLDYRRGQRVDPVTKKRQFSWLDVDFK